MFQRHHHLGVGLAFLDRAEELRRLAGALQRRTPVLLVVYGRRRCGKSTLLQRLIRPGDIYFLADERERSLQIQALAESVDGVLSGFSAARYPSWASLIDTLSARLGGGRCLFIDEFPYLVRQAPELPSLIQREIDRPASAGFSWVLCGSAQRMMQGSVLDRTAPLYGRAREIIQVRPLAAGWIAEALRLDPIAAVRAYAVWGGIPRYWELAAEHSSTRGAVRELVLDRNGVLHEEPLRLLRDDMRSPVQAYSLLSLVGAGCHRLSEIAVRVGKPAGSLTRAGRFDRAGIDPARDPVGGGQPLHQAHALPAPGPIPPVSHRVRAAPPGLARAGSDGSSSPALRRALRRARRQSVGGSRQGVGAR
jgi:AAA+ ATPase superfamily predicted ATPase